MNQALANQTAVVTITFEYLPGLPTDFHEVTPVWLDIGGCGGSDEPAKNDTAFQYTSPVWTANATGQVTCVAGHLHDGGTNLDITKNSDTLCDCVAAYGQNPGYIDPAGTTMNMGGMSGSMANMGKHISSLTECSTGQINLGDTLSVTAHYNTSEYSAMIDTDGSLAPIMGIGLMYVAQNETYTASATPTTSSGPSSSSSKAAAATSNVAGGKLWIAGTVGGMAALAFA